MLMKRVLSHIAPFIVLIFMAGCLNAQSTPVKVSNVVQHINGKDYYVCVAQQGQTVFSIARAYGLHYSAAVLKTDIHSLSAGDTVWLPVNDQSRAAVAQVVGRSTATTDESTVTIEVQQGQTLYGIAKQYNTTIDKILELNPPVATEGLKAGQRLTVPKVANGASAGTTASTTAKTPSGKTSRPGTTTTNSTSTAKATASTEPLYTLNVRDRIDKEKIHISVMMPLYLDKMGEISTTKFDVDQRGKKTFKSFEFIQFYEGILMAVDQLQQAGVKVVLNVVDVPSEDDATVVSAFNSHNCANSDLIIALLTRDPFAKAAQLARDNRVFIVSPMSSRSEILDNNPYVIKYMPSCEAMVSALLNRVASQYKGHHLFLIHSGSRNESDTFNEFKKQLDTRGDIPYTLFNWTQNAKLTSTLKTTKDNVVINIYDQGYSRNRVQLAQLMTKLSALSNKPTLMTLNDYVHEVGDIDFSQLQNLNYHMITNAYLNYDNPTHKAFIDNYKDRYKTEPQGVYAGVGHDIMLYFATALNRQGSQFWSNPTLKSPDGMLFPLQVKQACPSCGFENQKATLYRMERFHLVPAQ